jgi:lipoyl(octanoyl) transferase
MCIRDRTCAAFGVVAGRREGHPGCWVNPDGAAPRKIGALGIRVERGVSYHGIALNVAPNLADFDLIDPCGMPGLVSTSIAAETGLQEIATTAAVERAASVFANALATRLGADLAGFGGVDADRLAGRLVRVPLAAGR